MKNVLWWQRSIDATDDTTIDGTTRKDLVPAFPHTIPDINKDILQLLEVYIE